MAMANIPAPVAGKNFSIGAGFGNYADENAFAIGGKAVVGKDKNIILSVSGGYASSVPSVATGVSWSF